MSKQEEAERDLPYSCAAWDPRKEACCLAVPQSLSKGVREFCQDFLRGLTDQYHLAMASLRSVDPVHRKLVYLASEGADITDLRKPVLDWSDTGNLSGVAAESRKATFFDNIAEEQDGRRYAHPWLVKSHGLKAMASIPVLNTCNMNQVLLILNLYGRTVWTLDARREYTRLGDALASRFEEFLKDRCVRFRSRLSIEMTQLKKRSQEHMYAAAVKILGEALGANSVGIYIEKPNGRGVELRSSTGKDLGAKHSSDIDDLAEKCWSDNREFLTIRRPMSPMTCPGEFLPPPIPNVLEKTASSAFVPLRDLTGRPRGVFCCLKGEASSAAVSEGLSPFTYEDIALIEAIGQAFSPQFEILMAENRRTDSLNKLAHELRVPIVAFRAALERVESECRNRGYAFQYDHFKDLSTYCDVMNRLLQRLDAFRKGPYEIPLSAEEIVHVLSEIVPPAVRFVQPLLKKKRLEKKGITYIGLDQIPALYLDAGLMTTVVFNLLDNAIKYAKPNRDQFRVEIEGIAGDSLFEIVFRDWGVGVPEGWEEDIFDAGVRGPNAHEYDVAGQGLGLWFARDIVRRHGGDLLLRRNAEPTTFAIVLPQNLRRQRPQDRSQ